MGTIWVQEFTGGLDTRRLPETTVGGVLVKALNGHITRGGEFEKRAAFVKTHTLPAGTIGLAFDLGGPVVFGASATTATPMPAGVRYQQLIPYNSAAVLSRVPSYEMFAGKLYVVGEFSDGTIRHFYDGQPVTDWYDGRARFSFNVTAAGGGSLQTLTVDNVAIISGPVSTPGTREAAATAIAAAVNATVSTPDYTATATGTTVSISTTDASNAANFRPWAITVAAPAAVSPASGSSLSGGSDDNQLRVPGTFVRTIGTKMYAVSGPNLHFSGVAQPTKWTTATVGAGFIDFSSQASGFERLYAVSEYQQFVAIFAERATKIEYVDPDPSLNKSSQTLRNTGTASPRSVTQFGDNDIFYLDESGIRSLRARDASNAASTSDVGVPIDGLITAKLASLAFNERANIIGLIEPRDGRFWLIAKDTIYVFSFFSGAKVSAWSTYEPGFDIGDAGVFQRRVYVRSGDSLYVYGGLGTSLVYDATVAEAQLVYLDASKPTSKKMWEGLDAAVRGRWHASVGMDPADPDAVDDIAEFYRTTFDIGRITLNGHSTHISPIFRTVGTGPALLASVVVQFASDGEDAKD